MINWNDINICICKLFLFVHEGLALYLFDMPCSGQEKQNKSLSSTSSKQVLDHVVCYGLEPSFCQTPYISSALRCVLQNLFGDSSSIHSIDMLSPVLSLFACVFQHRFCLEFFHYFLILFVVPILQPAVCLHKPHLCCCDSGFIIFPNGPSLASAGQQRLSKGFINFYSGVFLY